MAKTKTVDMDHVSGRVKAFMHKVFSHVHYEGPILDAKELQKLHIMPVCTHRSQTDYFALGQFLNGIGVKRVRYAAGDNLTELPLIGPYFRIWGAFPVSRSRASSRMYIRNLAEQVADMLSSGDNVVVFPEGGRSYKGQMMDMKAGLIGAAIIAQWRNPDEEFAFLPTAISYEKLPELLYFDMLEKGKTIRGKNGHIFKNIRGNLYYFGADVIAFSKFLLAPKIKNHYGEMYIDFDEPVGVRSIVDIDALYNKRARDDFSALVKAMQAAGRYIYKKFLRLYRLLPSHIVASILKENDSCSIAAVTEKVQPILDMLNEKGRNMKTLNERAPAEIVEQGIQMLSAFKALSRKKNIITVRNPSVIVYHAATIDGHKEADR